MKEKNNRLSNPVNTFCVTICNICDGKGDFMFAMEEIFQYLTMTAPVSHLRVPNVGVKLSLELPLLSYWTFQVLLPNLLQLVIST